MLIFTIHVTNYLTFDKFANQKEHKQHFFNSPYILQKRLQICDTI